MLSRRPLLYLTIPSLALLIGLWFRRKKAIAARNDSGGGRNKTASQSESTAATKASAATHQAADRVRGKRDISESVPIGSGSDDDGSLLLNASGCSSTNSNKSSVGGHPITSSGPNSRSPPIPIANKPGCGGHTSDELNSGEDFDVASSGSSAGDLADSYERRNFNFVKNSHLYQKRTKGSMDVPVKVITASKSPKISPKNAFSEAAATATSTPAKKQQQSPKSAEGGEDSLVIQGQMAKLSLDDSVKSNGSSVPEKKVGINKEAQEKSSNKTTTSTTTQEPQQQPPTANSPPLSLYSVHSNDSGKGSSPTQSEVATAAGGVAGDQQTSQNNCYEFLVHEKWVGLLIGRGGTNVKKLHKRFGVHMIVRRVPNCPRPTDRVCAIMGASQDIKLALAFIRQRMPLDRYPDMSLERVHYASTPVPALGMKETVVSSSPPTGEAHKLAPSAAKKPVMPIHYPVAQLPLSLSLVEGINNDVVISAILNGGHVFLQQQSHPTFQQLQALHAAMAQSYAAGDSPALEVLANDSICVAPVAGTWYRVVIVSSHFAPEDHPQQMCLVKFLDFGGFVTVPAVDLRQIRTDYMALPFQSIECVLSNLRPIDGGEWSKAAEELVLQLGTGRVLQAQVAGYTVDGLPEVFLYATLGPDNIAFINQELVAQGYAEWMEDDDAEEEEEEEQQQEILAQ